MGSIYKITNTVNSKAYIGQTARDAKKRCVTYHLGGHGSQLVKQAVDKYGKDAFIIEILHDGIIPEFLDILEIEAIEKCNSLAPNGYNLHSGGGGSTPSDETRRKMSKAQKGKKLSAEHRRKISEANKGKKLSAEHRRKISEAHKGKQGLSGDRNSFFGKTHSDETRKKISEANKGKTISNEHRQKISAFMKGHTYRLGTKLSEAHRQKLLEVNTGRKQTEDAKRKLSKARTHPYKKEIYNCFLSLHSSLCLSEKRKYLLDKYSDIVHYSTIYRWVRSWGKEIN